MAVFFYKWRREAFGASQREVRVPPGPRHLITNNEINIQNIKTHARTYARGRNDQKQNWSQHVKSAEK